MLRPTRELIMDSVNLYRAHLWLFAGYAAWLLIPFVALLLVPVQTTSIPVFIAILTISAVQLLIGVWATICIMQTTNQLSENKLVESKVLSKNAIRRIQPLLIVAFLQGLITLGGMMLLIVPGVIFLFWYSLSQAAVAIDNKKPLEALSYSKKLVKGHFWSFAWRLITGPLIMSIAYLAILTSVLALIAFVVGVDASMVFNSESIVWVNAINTLAEIFILPLFIIYMTLLYKDMKSLPSVVKSDN
jgi:hypothetical protein